MIMMLHAVALAAAQPGVQVPAEPSAHGEAMAQQGRHCCCCAHGDRDSEGCAEHAHHRGHHSHD
jgi:hypothetical protein